MRPFQTITAIGHYQEPIRAMVHAIKYQREWPLAEYLADHLFEHSRVKAVATQDVVLIPVPLHPLRQLSRGFNQAMILARRLKKHGGSQLCDALVRIRDTETQTHMHSRAQRNRNMKDAFALESDRAIRGRHLVLVDDVMTSGSTLRAAAKAFKEARPASISAIVIAVADARGRGFERV